MTWIGTTLMLVVLTILCTSYAQLLQKQAAMDLTADATKSVLFNPAFIQSIFLLGIGMAIWLLVLRRLDVSVAYPLLSGNFILV
ncbi:MAG: 4-amino-4-deoxy-L-arabinose-phospho-UDP flippase, partial [Pseudomonadota bacterium]